MENGGEAPQPAYGHPTTAFAHVLFKVEINVLKCDELLAADHIWQLNWANLTEFV